MPLDIAHNQEDLARVEVLYLGQIAVVFYWPQFMDGDWLAEVAAAGQQADMHRVYGLWSEIIESWDVTDNGVPISTDAPGISSLPIPLMSAIFSACQQDAERRGRRTKAVNITGGVLNAIFGDSTKEDR